MNILTLQSAVAHGHVGNSAAELPLALLGFEVWRIDTVQFSNHPGHGRHRGRATPPELVADLLAGLVEMGLAAQTDAILSGYLGEAGTGRAIAAHVAAVKAIKPDALYLLDPVMGDVAPARPDGALYVAPAIPDAMRTALLPLADIATPNRFELETLTGRKAGDFASVRAAAEELRASGPGLVVVTSVDGADTPTDAIDTLAFSGDGVWRVRQPRHARRFDGAGDVFTALFLGNFLTSRDPADALGRAISSLAPVLEATERQGGLDLALVAAIPEMLDPPRQFMAERVG
jgi:pyridoxine kinase